MRHDGGLGRRTRWGLWSLYWQARVLLPAPPLILGQSKMDERGRKRRACCRMRSSFDETWLHGSEE